MAVDTGASAADRTALDHPGDDTPTDPPGGAGGHTGVDDDRRRTTRRPARRLLRDHRVFIAVLALGVAVRVVAMAAYHSALFFPDSIDYLLQSENLSPRAWHPLGYPALLRLLSVFHSVAAAAALNHLFGLAAGVIVYLLLLRLGVRPWIAAAAAAPVLLDAFQIQVEQFILSDALFELLVTAAAAVLFWRPPGGAWRRPSVPRCLVVGLLLAAASVTRFDGAVVTLAVVGFLLVRRAGVWRVAVVLAAVVVPIVAYAGWYDAANGQFTLSGDTGLYLYGRISPFADCTGVSMPSYERRLCITVPPDRRQIPNWYISYPRSPARTQAVHDGEPVDAQLLGFDLRIILHQPLAYVATVLSDASEGMAPGRWPIHGADVEPWHSHPYLDLQQYDPQAAALVRQFGGPAPTVTQPFEHVLAAYQQVLYVPGTLYGILALGSLVVVARRRWSAGTGVRAECATFVAIGLLPYLFAVATALFEWRYELTMLVTLPPAAALAATALLRTHPPRRGRHSVGAARTPTPGVDPEPVTVGTAPALAD